MNMAEQSDGKEKMNKKLLLLIPASLLVYLLFMIVSRYADITKPTIKNLNMPNKLLTQDKIINISADISDKHPDKKELWTNSTGEWHLNKSQNYNINFTPLNISKDGVYAWNICASDAKGNYNCNDINLLTIDTDSPKTKLISPESGYIANNSYVNFTWSSYDVNFKNCSFRYDLKIKYTTKLQGVQSYVYKVNETGKHKWYVQCYDDALNVNGTVSNVIYVVGI